MMLKLIINYSEKERVQGGFAVYLHIKSEYLFYNWANTLKCLSIGTPKSITFAFAPSGNVF